MFKNSKIYFLLLWILLICLVPITVLRVTPWSLVKDHPAQVANLIQRLIGLWAYTLLFVQIVLGAFMTRWIEKLGPWIFKFHVFEGILIYSLIIFHPLVFTYYYYLIGKGFDPFYTFVDVCVICKKDLEYSYNFGRIGFWLLTVGVFAGLFRAATPFLRQYWHKLHIVNYLAFLVIWYHSLKVGSDVGSNPFSFVHTPFFVVVAAIIIWKLKEYFQSRISRDKVS